NRTTDTVIFSHVLYQLSYLGPRAILQQQAASGKGGGAYSRRNPGCPDSPEAHLQATRAPPVSSAFHDSGTRQHRMQQHVGAGRKVVRLAPFPLVVADAAGAAPPHAT